MPVCIHVLMCIRVHVCIYVFACICVCVYVCASVYTCLYVHKYKDTYVCKVLECIYVLVVYIHVLCVYMNLHA